MIDQIGYGLLWKQDKTTTWSIVWVGSTLKTILNCSDWLDQVQSVTKTRQDNDVIDHIGMTNAEIKIELSRLIKLGAIFNRNKTWLRYDQSYKYGKHRKQNWVVMTDLDMSDHIGLVYAEIETELSRPIWPSAVYDENW